MSNEHWMADQERFSLLSLKRTICAGCKQRRMTTRCSYLTCNGGLTLGREDYNTAPHLCPACLNEHYYVHELAHDMADESFIETDYEWIEVKHGKRKQKQS